jgi:DNA-binding winged helix-turn-helix (wHTH) protein
MATTIDSVHTPEDTDLLATAAHATEPLTQREVVLLQTLLANQGRVVARTELARAVGLRQQARRVDVHLVNVRRALDDSLINVRGRGWMVPREYAVTEACRTELDAHFAADAIHALDVPDAVHARDAFDVSPVDVSLAAESMSA